MEFRTLNLTILSANDIKQVNFFSKMDVYVVVSMIDSADNHNLRSNSIQKQRTPIDKKGDKNPTWNYTISFTINDVVARQNRLYILFEIFSSRSFPGDKLIGKVQVPVYDLLNGYGDRKDAILVSYQVRKRSGKPKGVFNVSYKFGEKFTVSGSVNTNFANPNPNTSYPYPQPPVYAYPAPQTGYGYPYQGQGHGYQRRNNMGMGMGVGAGLLGGMLIGDMVSHAGYDGGYDGGFDGGYDGGGFDGGFDF